MLDNTETKVAITAAGRKASERQRKREAGLKPLEVWAKPENHAKIRAYAAQIEQQLAR